MFARKTAALFLAAGLAVVAAGACGGDGGKGGGVTGPSTIRSIALTPATDYLLKGETLQFSAAATYTDGTTAPASGSWGTDAPSVATIDSTGKVTAVGSGKATIWHEMQGVRGTRLLTAHPNYRGGWSGGFVIRSCAQSGDFATANLCADMTGGTDTIKLQVTQDRVSLSGTIDLGGYPSPFTGSVRDDGTMVLDAAVPVDTLTATVRNWTTRSEITGSMTGTFTLVFSEPRLAGSAEWSCQLTGMQKTSGALQASGMPAVAGGLIRSWARSVIR